MGPIWEFRFIVFGIFKRYLSENIKLLINKSKVQEKSELEIHIWQSSTYNWCYKSLDGRKKLPYEWIR